MKKYLSIALVAILALAGVRFVCAQEMETEKAVAMDNAVMANAMMNEEADEATMDEENNEAMDEVKGDVAEMEKDASAPAEAAEKKMGY